MCKATYKCRMCGDTFEGSEGSSLQDFDSLLGSILQVSLKRFSAITGCLVAEKTAHICKDGSIGYADFVGFRKENEDG